jgi:hypothetical protein
MSTTTKRTTKQATKAASGKVTAEEKPKKLSKLGQWMREHPKGDMVIHDRSVLYN